MSDAPKKRPSAEPDAQASYDNLNNFTGTPNTKEAKKPANPGRLTASDPAYDKFRKPEDPNKKPANKPNETKPRPKSLEPDAQASYDDLNQYQGTGATKTDDRPRLTNQDPEAQSSYDDLRKYQDPNLRRYHEQLIQERREAATANATRAAPSGTQRREKKSAGGEKGSKIQTMVMGGFALIIVLAIVGLALKDTRGAILAIIIFLSLAGIVVIKTS